MRRSLLSEIWPSWVRRWFAADSPDVSTSRAALDHVVILDGTMSSLDDGLATNAGLTYQLLCEAGQASVYYEAGVQLEVWRDVADVLMGRGINRQIRDAYAFLASRYRPGDRIFLLGYSRGAYAVRSLAGVIDRIGLLRHDEATEANIRQIYRLYEFDPHGPAAEAFAQLYCHPEAPIEMVGVWDTVKALGLRLPLLWRLSEPKHAFHSAHLGESIRHGFHALALNETRIAYHPVLWECYDGYEGIVEQVWFRGSHGDVGGQLNGFDQARGLSNIPLVWMLEKAARCGLSLPEGWAARFACDPDAPSVGTWRGFAKLFLLRAPREVGKDPSERVHPTAEALLSTPLEASA